MKILTLYSAIYKILKRSFNQASFFKLVKNCLKHHDRRDIFLKNPLFDIPDQTVLDDDGDNGGFVLVCHKISS